MKAPVAFLLAGFCASALAQAPGRNEFLQKELLVRRLLEAGPSIAAAELHARALQHSARGEFGEADARLNEALRAVQLERRQSDERPRYESRLASVELMRSTYARHAGAREDFHGSLLAEVDHGVAQARRLRAGGRADEAVRALERAERSLTHALTEVLGSVTVSYAVRPAGPREEYEHELARNRAYAALVPAAIHELRPSGAALLLVRRHVESAEATTAAAARDAARESWDGALEKARSGTQHLQRALGAAGLAVPQELAE